MKQHHNNNPTRRSNNSDGNSGDTPTTILWLIFHTICCLISFILGFRFSHLVFFLLFSQTSTTTHPSFITLPLFTPNPPPNRTTPTRAMVGRHGIMVRPWPHPNPKEVIQAHNILDRVQKEQRELYGVRNPRGVIVVTTTYVRSFQAMHMTGLMHGIMNGGYDNVVWVVVEAGGVSNETRVLIEKARVRTLHVGFDRSMPESWPERSRVEDLMRVHALRLIRDRKLDGIVIFADESNIHSLELFDEVQRVKHIGALPLGILIHSHNSNTTHINEEGSPPIQGPVCNSLGSLVGWHTFDGGPYSDSGAALPKKMEWAGLVLDARLLWSGEHEWVHDLDGLDDDNMEISPLALLKDQSVVEPLGDCGCKVLVWWVRVEGPTGSKFPPRWVIHSPPEVTVGAKRAPGPDVPRQHAETQPPKAKSRRHRGDE